MPLCHQVITTAFGSSWKKSIAAISSVYNQHKRSLTPHLCNRNQDSSGTKRTVWFQVQSPQLNKPLLRVPQGVSATQENHKFLFIYFIRRSRRYYENYNQSVPYRSSSHLRIPVRFFLLNYVKTKVNSYFS